MNMMEMMLMMVLVLPIAALCVAFFVYAQWIQYCDEHSARAALADGPADDVRQPVTTRYDAYYIWKR